MKHVGVAFATLAFAGTASAAIFAPPSASTVTIESAQEAAISLAVVKAAAHRTIESGRAPVPYVPHAKSPAPQLASLTEPLPSASETQPAAPTAKAPKPRADIGRATASTVSNLSVDRCGGGAIKSITVSGDGSMLVQC